ncbi:hypothetical protein LXL04_030455 [Taraxacum kok-saghyz]
MLGSGSARLGLARLGSIRLASLFELTNIGSGSARLINELLNGTRARLGLVRTKIGVLQDFGKKNCADLQTRLVSRDTTRVQRTAFKFKMKFFITCPIPIIPSAINATEGEQHHHPRWWLPAISKPRDREIEEHKAAAAALLLRFLATEAPPVAVVLSYGGGGTGRIQRLTFAIVKPGHEHASLGPKTSPWTETNADFGPTI